MALSAILFDVDGTLIDTNRAHVEAWETALLQHDYRVSADRIAVEIGKGGDKLIPSILGKEAEKRDGESLRKAHTAEYLKIAKTKKMNVFRGAEALFRQLKDRNLKLALATSSSEKELHATLKSAGVDWSRYFDVVATGDDNPQSKPAPGIVTTALEKLKLAATQCAMVGDTPYDCDAARDSGVVCIGVTCGEMNDANTLRATGMRAVYRDPADICDHLEDALHIASPGRIVLTQELIDMLMHEALAVAEAALATGEAPIGCVIARGDGVIIARGHNELNSSQNKTAHAEMTAFNRASGKSAPDARDLILACTLEPCVMCLGASMEAAVDTILYGLNAPADGGRLRVRPPVSPESQMPRLVGNQLAAESRALFKKFLDQPPANPRQAEFVKQLLRSTHPTNDSSQRAAAGAGTAAG